jgi:coenzyme F420-reducing hydrogenase beta subunit
LLITVLRAGLADAVMVIDAERPSAPSALVTNDEDEVARCVQLSYCLTLNLQLLGDARISRVAAIGFPCEIQAIRKIKNLIPAPAVADKVILTTEIA